VPGNASVRVWVAPLRVPAAVLTSLVAGLAPDEQARAGRYRFGDDARRFSAARGWLRHVLAAETGSSPGRVSFAAGPGKPRLADGAGPRFNLSYSEDLALVAVADREVGVDVEHLGRGLRVLDAASVACTPGEVAALRRLPPAPRADAFLRIWTAKEAFLKGTGQGLSVPPDRVEIGDARPDGATPVRMAGPKGRAEWWLRSLSPAPDYVGAVAAEGGDWEVELRSASVLIDRPGAG
jgi:4'-phosphopantetheinyl transferase